MNHTIPITILPKVIKKLHLIDKGQQTLLEDYIAKDNSKGFFNALKLIGFISDKINVDSLGPCKDLSINLELEDNININMQKKLTTCKSIW